MSRTTGRLKRSGLSAGCHPRYLVPNLRSAPILTDIPALQGPPRLAGTNDHDRAWGVLRALLADGSEEQPVETPGATRTDDQLLGSLCRGKQDAGGIPQGDVPKNVHLRLGSDRSRKFPVQELPRCELKLDATQHRRWKRRMRKGGRWLVLPDVDGNERRASATGVREGPGQRLPRRRRPVDTYYDSRPS